MIVVTVISCILRILKGIRYTVKEGNSIKILLPPFGKVIYSKTKDFAPPWKHFFSFLNTPFPEGARRAKGSDFPFRISF